MFNGSLLHLRASWLVAACIVYAGVFMAAGIAMGRPRAVALRELARNEKLHAQVAAMRRANADMEREWRYYDTDAGREEIARSLGWVRHDETPILFTK